MLYKFILVVNVMFKCVLRGEGRGIKLWVLSILNFRDVLSSKVSGVRKFFLLIVINCVYIIKINCK